MWAQNQAGVFGPQGMPAQYPQYTAPQQPVNDDTGSFGWAVLGFFIPVVGLVLWLVWKSDHPRNASAAGKGALVSVILCAAFYMLSFLLTFMSIAMFA